MDLGKLMSPKETQRLLGQMISGDSAGVVKDLTSGSAPGGLTSAPPARTDSLNTSSFADLGKALDLIQRSGSGPSLGTLVTAMENKRIQEFIENTLDALLDSNNLDDTGKALLLALKVLIQDNPRMGRGLMNSFQGLGSLGNGVQDSFRSAFRSLFGGLSGGINLNANNSSELLQAAAEELLRYLDNSNGISPFNRGLTNILGL